jgi:hypothetical protein
MTEYPNSTVHRTCSATGRPLKAGERYFGVLALEGGKFVRQEFSEQGWMGAPPGAFGYWAGRVPAAGDANRRPPIDDDLLLECFQRLDGETEPAKVNFRYVMALLLMRRKRFKFEDSKKEAGGNALIVRDARSNDRHVVADPGLTDEQMQTVQSEVFQMLGWNEQ